MGGLSPLVQVQPLAACFDLQAKADANEGGC
jgi:hypothetical protein